MMYRIRQIGNTIQMPNRANPNRGRIYDPKGIAPTIGCLGGGQREPLIIEHKLTSLLEAIRQGKYRIRKLTPMECFRLMDVSDKDINKIQSCGISKTQQYKMAGNSIVVSCLFHIFRKLFVDTQKDMRRGTQLYLFQNYDNGE